LIAASGFRRAVGRALSVTLELSSAKALLPFSGWLFGCIIMGGFASGTVARLINLFVNGSFLIK